MLPSPAGPSNPLAILTPWPRRAAVVLRLLVALAAAGCDALTNHSRGACVALGACDVPVPCPEAVDILIDRSTGAPDIATRRTQSIRVAAQFIAERPGSLLRVWVLGDDLAHTEIVREVSSPTLPKTRRARVQHLDRFVRETVAEFDAALTRASATSPPRRSPIAEGITKITALADGRGLPRRLIVVTDGREVSSVADFECTRRLPSTSHFRVALARGHLLQAGALQNVRVEFAHVAGAPIVGRRRCEVNAERELHMRALWLDALHAAGARHVRIESGPPNLDTEPSSTTERTESR